MHGFKPYTVVIRFQICIFDILNTASGQIEVSVNMVVIRFQICIFDILNTAGRWRALRYIQL